MNKDLQLSTSLDEPDLLKNMVEKLADKRYDLGYGNASVPASWQAIETSTVETYVKVTVSLSDANAGESDQINMPFTTNFIFTCIKETGSNYLLSWNSSLS